MRTELTVSWTAADYHTQDTFILGALLTNLNKYGKNDKVSNSLTIYKMLPKLHF